jgi:hypothetical protein
MRRPEALDLYLLLLAVAVKDPHKVQFPAAVWSRALGRGDSTNAELWVSKTLRWLEARNLIVRRPVGRQREITVRHDSTRDKKYTRPKGGVDPWEWFFNLPHRYFLDGWHKRLSASGKAVLLVAYANQDEFELNQRRGATWWGLSTDTLGRGLIELQEQEVLVARTISRKAPESRTGFAVVPLYRLAAPLAKPPPARRPKAAPAKKPRKVPR